MKKSFADVWERIGDLFQSTSRTDEAVAAFQKAIWYLEQLMQETDSFLLSAWEIISVKLAECQKAVDGTDTDKDAVLRDYENARLQMQDAPSAVICKKFGRSCLALDGLAGEKRQTEKAAEYYREGIRVLALQIEQYPDRKLRDILARMYFSLFELKPAPNETELIKKNIISGIVSRSSIPRTRIIRISSGARIDSG